MVNSSALRPYRGVALTATIVFLMLAPAPARIALIFFVPVVALWAFFVIVDSLTDSRKRKIALIKILIWIASFSAVVALHFYYQIARQSAGDALLAQVLEYKVHHGIYPKDLEAISPEANSLARSNGVLYFASDYGPDFRVESAWDMVSTRAYDFKSGTWSDNVSD